MAFFGQGIDAGGLTREMYAQFAIGTLELAPRLRIFKETAARNLVPEALTPETYGLEVRFNSILIPF